MSLPGGARASRDSILSKIRASLGATPNDPARLAAAEKRLMAKPRAAAPQRVAASGTDLVARFTEELQRQLATVVATAGAGDIPAVIAGYLRANNQPLRLRHGNDPYISSLDFAGIPDFETLKGRAAPDDSTGLSAAFAGIAETGTMALTSGADNPVTLGFLPDTHIIVVPRSRIVATYEDAFALLRQERGPTPMPRTLNLISGPSRTADIGGRIVIGAHGPRRLLAIVTGDL
ncbi:MAG: LUD domain-containing protein [Alphaproteobacteria bacterium]|nr:LUD domain-containing protein [Alphaproteobacteria bacterium]